MTKKPREANAPARNLVLVLTTDAKFTRAIEAAAKPLTWVSRIVSTQSEEELIDVAGRWPETNAVLLTGPGWEPEQLTHLIRASLEAGLDPSRIVVAFAHPPLQLAGELSDMGVKNLVNLPVKPDDLWTVIRGAGTAAENRNGKLVTVFSSKGGVGTTLIAVNLAVIMSAWPERRTALIDLDLNFGDVGAVLGLLPTKNLYDYARNSPSGTTGDLASYMNMWNTLSVMLAPPRPELSELVSGELIDKVLSRLCLANDIVVVDTPSVFSDNVLALLERTDELVVVVTADIAAAKNVKIALQTLSLLKFPRQKIRLVLNHLEHQAPGFIEELQKELGMPLTMELPRDNAVTIAGAKAVPVVSDAPRTHISRSLVRLAGIVGAGIGIDYDSGEKKAA